MRKTEVSSVFLSICFFFVYGICISDYQSFYLSSYVFPYICISDCLSFSLSVCLSICLSGRLYFWFSVYRSFCNWRVHGPIGREDQRRHWKQCLQQKRHLKAELELVSYVATGNNIINRKNVERPNWNSSRTSPPEIISSSKDRIETCYWSRCRLQELGPEMIRREARRRFQATGFSKK